MSVEFEVKGVKYRAEKLDVFEQWDVSRRLLPVIGGAADVMVKFFKNGTSAEAEKLAFHDLLKMDISEIIGPLTKALAEMSDADSRFILDHCLAKISRHQGNMWAPVSTTNGPMMFADIDMLVMLQLVRKVVEISILSFSSARPASSN